MGKEEEWYSSICMYPVAYVIHSLIKSITHAFTCIHKSSINMMENLRIQTIALRSPAGCAFRLIIMPQAAPTATTTNYAPFLFFHEGSKRLATITPQSTSLEKDPLHHPYGRERKCQNKGITEPPTMR